MMRPNSFSPLRPFGFDCSSVVNGGGGGGGGGGGVNSGSISISSMALDVDGVLATVASLAVLAVVAERVGVLHCSGLLLHEFDGELLEAGAMATETETPGTN